MVKLKEIDKAAEKKGSALTTLWQFVKFIVVSLLAMIVQFSLLNILSHIPAIVALGEQPFNWFVFNYPVEAVGLGGLGYFIAFNVSNVAAQIVAFFVNKEKTFNSGANIAVALPIYIVFTILLICFSAWLSPTLNGIFLGWGWPEAAALNVATAVCSAIQFFLYFPVDKILFKKKKKED